VSEIAQEGYVQEAPEAASEPAADAGGWQDYGQPGEGAVVDEGWSGVTQEEWAATQQALGAIAQLLTADQQQAVEGFDPFADDGGRAQLDAMIAERVAPIAEIYEGLQQQAALEEGDAAASRIVAETAEQLGATVDESTVRETAEQDVRTLAGKVLADAGYSPPQVKAALAADPLMPYEVLARAYTMTVADVAQHALQTAVARMHGDATRQPGPSGVLSRYTKQAAVARESSQDPVTAFGAARIRAARR
jgi:hypothetical protein